MIKKCILCGEKLFEKPLLTLADMPAAAQNIPSKEEILNDNSIELNLCQCASCGLIQFDCEPVAYYKDVIRSGGFTTTMYNLRKEQYSHLIETYGLKGKKFLEVGCGQGEFLSVLTEFDVQVFGIEHKKELVSKAREKGLKVQEGFLSSEEDVLHDGPFDVFLSFNFFEHQPDPNGMLRAIYGNLTDEGLGLITVPSFEYIWEHDGYYELIRDHLVYYTFDTLRFALEKNGFQVLEEMMINRDTISMIVRKRPRLDVSKLTNSYDSVCKELNQYIDSFLQQGKKVALWGAGHQGFTLASTAKLQDKVVYIIDSAPFKQGRYAPGSHIPIISPDDVLRDKPDAIIIMAPGYTEEIAHIIKKRYGKDIEIAVMKSKHLELYGE